MNRRLTPLAIGIILIILFTVGLLLFAASHAFGQKGEHITGVVEVLIEDRTDQTAAMRYWLKEDPPKGSKATPLVSELKLSPSQARGLKTGMRVKLTGHRAGREILVLEPMERFAPLTSMLTTGNHSVAIILTSFADKVETTTPAQALSVLATASNHYQEGSYGAASLSGAAFGPVTITQTSTAPCDTTTIWNQAIQKATAQGYVSTNFQHTVVKYPPNPCGFWGVASITGGFVEINGSLALQVLAHELGHNFGLFHSHSCTVTANTCTTAEYGDNFDNMGYSNGPWNPFQIQRLGWLTADVPTGSGQYVLMPFKSGTTTRALRIPGQPDLWIQYNNREDQFNTWQGVLVHTGNLADANSSILRPPSPLAVGQTYTAPNGVTVKVISIGASAAVQIGMTGPTATPTVVVSKTPIPATASPTRVPPTATPAVTPGDQTWTTWAGAFTITGTKLVNVASKTWTTNIATTSGTAGSLSATFTALSNDGGRFGVVARLRDSRNYVYASRWSGGTAVCRIARVVNGVETTLATRSMGNPVVGPAGAFKVTLAVNGSTLTASCAGGTPITATDNSPDGLVGILLAARASQQADGFKAGP